MVLQSSLGVHAGEATWRAHPGDGDHRYTGHLVTLDLSYPTHLETTVVLRDGSVAHIRPVRHDDDARLLEFLQSMPLEDRRLRFFGLGNNLERTAHAEADVDYANSLGLVVTVAPQDRIVAHGMYAMSGPARAEVAFSILPEYQSRGIATLLLGQLAEAAAAAGFVTFEARMLRENRRMLEVFRQSGFPVETHYAFDTIEATFPTALTPEALARFDQRDELAAAGALRLVLEPRSVAVIGASHRTGSVGEAVLRNLLAAGFPGPIYPVNPSTEPIRGLRTYPSVDAVADAVELAIVAVPQDQVLEVAAQCGRKGVHALVVLTAGFGEVGAEGQQRQAELVQICRQHGMRLIGPNCIGVVNTDPRHPLNATFGPFMPPDGRIGMATQSGAIALAAIDFTAARSLGFSSLVSMGNKADISGNDLLGYWHSDPRTDVILLYLESFGNPRKFARLARSIGRTKPIVALKSGRSSVGARATASHTGALLAGSDVTVDALFRQAGVIRTDTLDEMLDVADLLVHQPLPTGARVAIVTNVGGPAIMCADTCEARGLEVPVLAASTQASLRAVLPPAASVTNPVDLLASATADQYERCIGLIASDPNVDAVISIFLAPLATRPEDVSAAVCRAVDRLDRSKPVLAVFMSSTALPPLETAGGVHVPGYHTPEPAAIALAHAARYAVWRDEPLEPAPALTDIHRDEAGLLLADALQREDQWLNPEDVQRVLRAYGLPVLDQRIAASPMEAAAAARELGGEVAIKAIAPGLIHKSDAGAVRLHVGVDSVANAAREMAEDVRATLGVSPTGFLVQPMASSGVEMLIGVVSDPRFGPVVACSAGGTLVELLKDVAVRLAPVSSSDARKMLRELRSFPLLQGYRGTPTCDVAALEDALVRVSALVENHPSIVEMDLNPVIVSPTGAVVVDARIRVAATPPRRPIGARL